MQTCPSCGEESPDGFTFCGYCAASLAPGARPVQEERKVVSVLFCDLVGFTAASDRADPEDVRATLRLYHQRVRREIERAGGVVEKFIGDAVMGVFGAPVAHEDDATRAVLASLKVLDAISELNEHDPRLNLAVRIGINTGDALVALDARPEIGEGMVAGDVVNTAARLQQVAPIGAVVVGAMTHLMTRNIFTYEEIGPVEVKGKLLPLHVWRVIGPIKFDAEAGGQALTPFVGRNDDLSLLRQTFDRSVREGSLQLVTIVGEPGAGKSRLVDELRRQIDELPEPCHWRQGRCLPYGEGITFWALGEIVKTHAGILESDSPEVAASKLREAVPLINEREWLYQRLLPLIGLGTPGGEQEELFAAWRMFVESLAEDRPSVLVFDDIHWADDSMLDFIEYLADWAHGLPILLLALARPEIYERRPGWSGGKRNASTVNLAPLSGPDTMTLLSGLLDQAPLPPAIQSLILDRIGGNPLYAEEFARLLKDRGFLVQNSEGYSFDEGAEVPLPETLHALIAARLDTLAPDRKGLLQDAAVIGKVFWSGAVSSMGQTSSRSVADALHELSRKELVRASRVSSLEGESEYTFWHTLVRDVAYSQIPRVSRADKHRRAAGWIELQTGGRIEDHAEVLAHHYTQALDLERASGRADESRDLADRALRFLVLAGDRALGLDTAKAEVFFTRALALAPPEHRERATVLARWADAARERGRQGEAALALQEAVASFKAQGRAMECGRTLTVLASVLWFEGDATSGEVIAEAVRVLESLPSGPDLVDAYAEAGRLKSLRGEHIESIAWSDRAIAVAADLGLPEPAKPLGYRGFALFESGNRSGLEDVRKALSLAVDRGDGLDAAVLHNNLALLQYAVEGPVAALRTLRQAADFCERRGLTSQLIWNAAGQMEYQFLSGAWDGIVESAEDLAAKIETVGSDATLVMIRELQARVLINRGRVPQALEAAEWAVDATRTPDDASAFISARASGAMARLASGDHEGAKRLVAEVEQRPQSRAAITYFDFLPGLVRTCISAGDVAMAERLVSGLEPRYPLEQHSLVAARAALAEAHGKLQDAVTMYEDAARRWKAFDVVPEQAFALLGQGRTQLALQRPGEALPTLRECREIFAQLRAGPMLAETDSLLKQAIASSRTVPPQGLEP